MKPKITIYKNKTVALIEGQKGIGLPAGVLGEAMIEAAEQSEQKKIANQFTTIEGDFVFILTD